MTAEVERTKESVLVGNKQKEEGKRDELSELWTKKWVTTLVGEEKEGQPERHGASMLAIWSRTGSEAEMRMTRAV
jgi:hypothetical protein